MTKTTPIWAEARRLSDKLQVGDLVYVWGEKGKWPVGLSTACRAIQRATQTPILILDEAVIPLDDVQQFRQTHCVVIAGSLPFLTKYYPDRPTWRCRVWSSEDGSTKKMESRNG